jgi:hypothetical protein
VGVQPHRRRAVIASPTPPTPANNERDAYWATVTTCPPPLKTLWFVT